MKITVRCELCTLERSFDDATVVPKDWKNDAGDLICPNDGAPMKPVGLRTVIEKAAPKSDLPPAETVETLSKRLGEIEHARSRVTSAQARYKEAKEGASEARKHLDDEMETFLTIVRRLATIPQGVNLPLFTQEAEAAAQDVPSEDDGSDPVVAAQRNSEELLTALADAGYFSATVPLIDGWTDKEYHAAQGWLGNPVDDALPDFMRALTESVEDAEPIKA